MKLRIATLIFSFFTLLASQVLAEAIPLSYKEMYNVTSRGLQFSKRLTSLKGQQIKMVGFMAPPLTPTINFFVLAEEPMAICPFCSTDADWPDNIIVVKLEKPVVALPFDRPIIVEGMLEIGSEVDAETGFVSQVRIRAKNIKE
ncbi:hypothetical protein [Taylorella equigenitalis]|uniref:hypothetical protein n=1 Tax=Taylorella equigenitalis TaxID=29575 RepID=UPI0003FCAB4A|nr:hypothetical protein [Taylorella equigenitalis]ASY38358.1 hypothetical protein CA605_06750 [Taylorella equigenitalis]KGK33749.1 hypothetical protein LW90_02255 [Taylorella equigenitalis]RBA26893.1 hypothetical protein DQW13_00125 [Taylorella equigenitalis]WDU46251.1 hypothetical protein KNO33_07045 [Taylorella equigenitalis]WDU49246.1 hypothetical protein KNO34_07140 [Taylorella equigenitalis]